LANTSPLTKFTIVTEKETLKLNEIISANAKQSTKNPGLLFYFIFF